jgi:hypothetical protein
MEMSITKDVGRHIIGAHNFSVNAGSIIPATVSQISNQSQPTMCTVAMVAIAGITSVNQGVLIYSHGLCF